MRQGTQLFHCGGKLLDRQVHGLRRIDQPALRPSQLQEQSEEPLLYLGGFETGGQVEARVRRLPDASATDESMLEGMSVEVTLEPAAPAAPAAPAVKKEKLPR